MTPTDRLAELMDENEVLYGLVCRDTTLIEVELMAQVGYHMAWVDLEHGAITTADALRLCRSMEHLGIVPMARIIELTRTEVQRLLDGGFATLILPNVKDAAQAAEFVRLGKYPPLGERGLSGSSAGTGYTLGDDPERTIRQTNRRVRLMVQVESDEGLANLDAILQVEGIDMVTVGPADWAVSLGLFGDEAKAEVGPKVDRVFTAAVRAGKIAVHPGGAGDQTARFIEMGVRLFFVGVDVPLKRKMLTDALDRARVAP